MGRVPNQGPARWSNVADLRTHWLGSFAFGNTGRNILAGPGRIKVNLSLFKNLRDSRRERCLPATVAVVPSSAMRFLSGRNRKVALGVTNQSRPQVRWEVFNVLNHANFQLPVNTVNAPNAGTLTSAGSWRR